MPTDKRKQKHNNLKPMGCSKSSSQKVVYSNINLSRETRKKKKNLSIHLKELEKEQINTKLVEKTKP